MSVKTFKSNSTEIFQSGFEPDKTNGVSYCLHPKAINHFKDFTDWKSQCTIFRVTNSNI